MKTIDPLRLLALWALVHEVADESWKEAVARGQGGTSAEGTPVSGTDILAAAVSAEKDRLRARLQQGDDALGNDGIDAGMLEKVLFDIGELRGRMDRMETLLETILRRLGDTPGRGPTVAE